MNIRTVAAAAAVATAIPSAARRRAFNVFKALPIFYYANCRLVVFFAIMLLLLLLIHSFIHLFCFIEL